MALGLAVAGDCHPHGRPGQLLDRVAVAAAPEMEEPFPIPVAAQGSQDLTAFLGLPPAESVERSPEGRVTVRRDSAETAHEMPDVKTLLIRGGTESSEITEGDPNSGVWRQKNIVGYKRAGWDCRTVAGYEITSTADFFLVKETLEITKGRKSFFSKRR